MTKKYTSYCLDSAAETPAVSCRGEYNWLTGGILNGCGEPCPLTCGKTGVGYPPIPALEWRYGFQDGYAAGQEDSEK